MVSCNLENLEPCLSQFHEIQLFFCEIWQISLINYNKPYD